MVKRRAMRIGLRAAIVLLLTGLAGLSPAAAQQRKDDEPGKFDFYVLVLSWSPSYCASVEERAADRRRRPDQQCEGGRPYAFVVHGLWPQYERGFPSWCQVPAPRIPRTMVDGMLEEVTQPFEMLWPTRKPDAGYPPTLDAIENDPGDWGKRQLEAFTCLSPASSRGGSDLWGQRC